MSISIPRSPRETLGGYVFLPRLIDKVRLQAKGSLPPEYAGNLLKKGLTADGRFLAFTGLDGEQLRNAILSSDTDESVLAWVQRHALPKSTHEIQQWAIEIDAFRPDLNMTQTRIKMYPELAKKIDISNLGIFDMIDMDEGRKPTSKPI